MMRILLGMPCYGGIHPEVVKNLIDFDIDSQREKNDLEVMFPRGTILSQSRNMIMRKAQEIKADWVLMWDSDIATEKQFLPGMIETAFKHDAAVVGLAVINRLEHPKIYNFGDIKGGKYLNHLQLPKEPIQVDAIGTGIMLINMDWINKNFPKAPWFSTIDTETGCFPEDWHFCEEVIKRRGKVMVDPRFKTIHHGEKAYENGVN